VRPPRWCFTPLKYSLASPVTLIGNWLVEGWQRIDAKFNGAGGVVAEQDEFYAGPVDGVSGLFHEFDGAVLLKAVGHGEVGEIHAAGGLLESHAHLRG
jgi:hypothetical protein